MSDFRRHIGALFAAGALLLAGCSKHTQTASAPTGSPTAAITAGATPPSPAASTAAAASPAETATPPPNLLAVQSGTIVREYPAGSDDPPTVVEGHTPDSAADPWVWVFELPDTAKLTSVAADVPDKSEDSDLTVTFAVSTAGPGSGFTDVATISSRATPAPDGTTLQTVRVSATARWVRVTAHHKGDARFSAIAAYGTIAQPATSNAAGTYIEYKDPYSGKSGAFSPGTEDGDTTYLRVVTADGSINAEECTKDGIGQSYPGTISGRQWVWKNNDGPGNSVINGDASLIVTASPGPQYWIRTNASPQNCGIVEFGNGGTSVLVLDSRDRATLYPMSPDADGPTKGYRFRHAAASLLQQSMLDSSSIAVFNGLCDAGDVLNAAQGQMLMRWVAAGHKLLITDSDMCGKDTHYGMLPYQFQSDNPGAQGAKGDRLILVEDNSLGTSDKSDKAHFFDAKQYAGDDNNQLGDANTVITQDPHWCGHLFGTNTNHVNGFMQMYALYGNGVIIYDGFDHDDGNVDSYRRVRMLELEQPIPADLPCTQKASLSFIIQPDQDGKFVPGKAVTLTFPMEFLANQGWKGYIKVTAGGDFKASVTPDSFDISGGTQPLKIAVQIPASAKPGTYAVIVSGDAGNGQSAQATIHLTAAVPLVKQFQQKRVRIYGIHFDVDKSRIKPQSESVIAEIAAVMKQNPAWRFRVEGHTDSDGGYQHNMVLSQHRAEAVVNDLVKRYHIARARLVPVGYGYSHPVAPNTTDAGKALNRRVELVRL